MRIGCRNNWHIHHKQVLVLVCVYGRGWYQEWGKPAVKLEPGVLTLFSMQTKEDSCKIYILEIYADKEAYQSHLQTAHFKKYKEGTAKMVKSLKLIDTQPMVGMEMLGH